MKLLRPLLLLTLLLAGCTPKNQALNYVDPNIGGVSVLLQPTRPTVQLPGQVIRFSPMRADLLDQQIRDFPLTLTSHRLHSVFGLLPLAGESDWLDASQEWDDEHVTPFAYSVRLDGCTLKYSCAQRSAVVQVAFDAGHGFIRLRGAGGESASIALEDAGVITGEEAFAGLKAFLYMESDRALKQKAVGPEGELLLEVDAPQLTLRYGISYICGAQAADNLSREVGNAGLDEISDRGRDVWAEALGRIRVEGGTREHLRMFYTALWRCHERMVDIGEYGRYYSAFDHSVHESARPFYTDNWIWDTYIALEPLWMILDPQREQDKIESYIEMYRQSGTMPSFATIFGDWPAMTGNYAAVWMADALVKGLTFNVEEAYAGVRHNALEETMLPWRNGPRCPLDDFYDAHGWFPALWPGEEETEPLVSLPWERRQAVSLSTAFAYSDWACGRLAGSLGLKEDEQMFLERSQWYRNVYRPDKGMFWPKDKDGNWIEGVDPRYMDRAYFTENNAYTFQWDVKHDLVGLFELMGGNAEAEQRLDELFSIPIDTHKFIFYSILPDATGMMGQFAMGNEPSFHIPYLYDYLGSAWKTQRRIHQIVDTFFSDGLTGIPGDEDGGAMSAFLVFSMMGFFPVSPGIPEYAIGSPFFERTDIGLPGGKHFIIKAKGFSEENKYISSAVLNGRSINRAWFTHDELMAGGTLVLTMSATPNPSWGTDPFR